VLVVTRTNNCDIERQIDDSLLRAQVLVHGQQRVETGLCSRRESRPSFKDAHPICGTVLASRPTSSRASSRAKFSFKKDAHRRLR
jgi:hypothetical protein